MKSILLATAALAAMAAGNAWAAQPTAASKAGTHHHATRQPGSGIQILFDQSGDDSGTGLSSQDFESSFDAFDDQGADDFTVPAFAKWYVSEIDVAGVYYNGGGPASSVNVTLFYHVKGKASDRNKPGLVKKEFDNLVPVDDGFGNFTITLPNATHLRSGTYWLSVQANMDFSVGGQWGWEISNGTKGAWPAVWRNPGNGFGTGCTDWSPSTCAGSTGDYLFVLRGIQIGGK